MRTMITDMRFLSVCSGIEAASVAWAPIGNSMAVNVMRWIGGRIALVDAMEVQT